MPVVTRVPLGPSTLNRKWAVDVNTATFASPNWVGIFGTTDVKPVQAPALQDDADFDSGGWGSSTVTGQDWALELTLARKVQAAALTLYDPGQEFVRLKAIQMGTLNQVDVRYYEYDPAGGPVIEAYRGYATVSWEENGGDSRALDTVACRLTGQGARTSITHPSLTTTPIPTITSLSPATGLAAGGLLVVATGSDLLSVTSMLMGVTAITSANFEATDNQHIAFITPAKSAGTYNVTATNAAGTSPTGAGNSFVYT